MKIRFNKFEKVAGLFVAAAAGSCIIGMTGIAVKNGWLAAKVLYRTELESADGVHAGTVVQIAGLRVGSVRGVELQSNDRVLVVFEVLERFRRKIHKDSQIQMFRPFILSEKVLEVSVGSEGSPILEVGSMIPLTPTTDIMDLLSGKKMGTIFSSFDRLAESVRIAGEAFADPKRTKALVQMLDRLNPLVQNLNTMSVEVVKVTSVANKQKHLDTILTNLAGVTEQLQLILPAFNEEVPDFGTQLGQIVKNLNVLTTEFQKLTPAIAAIAPELPRTTKRAVEALDETVIVLKAMQRSFLLRGKVEDVREEEKKRQPAAEDSTSP